MRYFAHLHTVEEIKKEFRRLAMENHPDRGGDTATMQEIIEQYHAALKGCDKQTSKDADNRPHTYNYSQPLEQEIVNKIDELIRAGVASANVEIWLIGTWVWIVGDTKPIKETLKKSGCTYHGKRQCWYWQNDGHAHRFSRKASMSDLAQKYGAAQFGEEEEKPKTRHRMK